jgi:hypothetical protein
VGSNNKGVSLLLCQYGAWDKLLCLLGILLIGCFFFVGIVDYSLEYGLNFMCMGTVLC